MRVSETISPKMHALGLKENLNNYPLILSGAREAKGRPSEANSSLLFSSITQKFKIQVQIYISIIYTLDIYLVKYSNHDMKNWFVVQLPRTCKFGVEG